LQICCQSEVCILKSTFAYGLAGENAFTAIRIYTERFEACTISKDMPNFTYSATTTRNGKFDSIREMLVDQCAVIFIEEEILNAFYDNPGLSLCRHVIFACRHGRCITLYKRMDCPYQHVQKLLPGDARVNFCVGIIIDFFRVIFSL